MTARLDASQDEYVCEKEAAQAFIIAVGSVAC